MTEERSTLTEQIYCIMAKVVGDSKPFKLVDPKYKGLTYREAYALANQMNERAYQCESVSFYIPSEE